MIHKVKDQETVTSLENGRSFERDSMNQSAVDSFTNIVVTSASEMLAKGANVRDVAAKFKLEEKFLKGLLESNTSCSTKQEPQEYVPEMKKKASPKNKNRELTEDEQDALDAYNGLHNKDAQHTPVLPNMSSKRILSNKGGDITEVGGPQKQMGSERNNSIWDSEVIARATQKRTNDEIIREKNAEIAAKK